ncbi:MAG: hypothetical protein WCO52_01340 [bacterium]
MNELMTQGQLDEVGRLFAQPFVDHGITVDDYQIVRQDPAFKALLQGPGEYVRKFIVRRDSVSSYLFVDALPESGYTKANTTLTYDWSKRGSEDDRLGNIAKAVKAAFGINDVVLTNSVVAMPAWQTCLVVSPVDLLLQMGLDPASVKNTDYCKLVASLMNQLAGVKPTDYVNTCLATEAARLEAETLKAWLAVPTTQEKGQPLIVRRMAVNPAIWLDHEGTAYSFAPLHTPALFANLPVSNKVKKVLPGDMVVAASLLIGEPHLVDQIKAGACPRIDVPGTELRDDGSWSGRPCVDRDGSEAWIDFYFAVAAVDFFGSLGCAWE